ncbi:PQQ-binding-like beta-propeller repeat protein [Nocardiopsis coralliicola]
MTAARDRRRRLSGQAAAAALLLLAAACGRDVGAADDAEPRSAPPEAAPGVEPSAVPPALHPEPLWRAPFSSAPKAAGDGYVGLVMPAEGEHDLRFLGVDADGTTRWETPRNPSCTGFAVTRIGGRDLVVLLDSDADPDRGAAATRTTAAAYDPADGTKAWGPVDVPGTLTGPGLVFGAIEHTIISARSGPKLALTAETGRAAADEEDGDLEILHEHGGALLVRDGDRLEARNTADGRALWDSGGLRVPDPPAGAAPVVSYGPRPESDSSAAVLLEWADGERGEVYAYTLHDLRSGEQLAGLAAGREPVLVGDEGGDRSLVHGLDAAGEEVLAAFGGTGAEPLWSRDPPAGEFRLERIAGGAVYGSAGPDTVALEAATGRGLGSGPWSAPVAATADSALLPVEDPGPGEVFAALPPAR